MKKHFLKRSLCMLLAVLTVFSCVLFISPEVSAAPEAPVKGKQCADYRGWANDDARWYNVKMNRNGQKWSSSNSELCFYHVGCAVISYTKLLIQAGIKPSTFLPTSTDLWMTKNSGYTDSYNALADWKDMANIDSRISWAGSTTLSGDAATRKAAIMNKIKAGYYVIIGVKDGGHWVVVDNATSLKKGYPVIWDTCTGCSNPASYNVGRTLFSAYSSSGIDYIKAYKVSNVSYTVRYHANGGTGTMADTKATYGDTSKPTSPNAFTRSGYVFAGWTVMLGSNSKWYCRNSEGTSGWYTEDTIPEGYSKVIYPEGHHFAYASQSSSEVVHLYANWAKAYTVKYNANGGSGSMDDTIVVYGESTKTRTNTFTRSGYVFDGWYAYRSSDNKWLYQKGSTKKWYVEGKQPAGYKKAVYADGIAVSKSSSKAGDTVVFYAKWLKAYTVTYNANGGTGSMGTTLVPYGKSTKTLPNEFTREGYAFAGWYAYRSSDNKWLYQKGSTKKWYVEGKQPDGYKKTVYKNGIAVSKSSSKAGDTVVFYAKWQKAYTVKYNANGGTGTMSSTLVPYGTKTATRSNTFTKEACLFAGWNVHRASDNKWLYQKGSTKKWYAEGKQPAGYAKAVYEDGIAVSKNSSVAGDTVTFYAVWKADPNAAASTMAISNAYMPPAKLAAKTAFTISGVVKSNYTITSLTVSVANASTGKTAFSKTVSPNAKSYSLFKLDGAMSFSSLAAGSYRLTVKATDAMGTKTLVNQTFATANATFSSSGLTYPSGTLTKGNAFGISGTVTASGKIKSVELSVYTTDGVKKFAASAAPGTASYDVSKLDSQMTFKSLPVGSYIYRVKVTDKNNVTRFMITKSFKVA